MDTISPELMEGWRKEFESLIAPHFKMESPSFNYRNGDSYYYAHMNLAWISFVLSRQATVIELPEKMDAVCFSMDHKISVIAWNDAIDEAKGFIESQGYRVEVKSE